MRASVYVYICVCVCVRGCVWLVCEPLGSAGPRPARGSGAAAQSAVHNRAAHVAISVKKCALALLLLFSTPMCSFWFGFASVPILFSCCVCVYE